MNVTCMPNILMWIYERDCIFMLTVDGTLSCWCQLPLSGRAQGYGCDHTQVSVRLCEEHAEGGNDHVR